MFKQDQKAHREDPIEPLKREGREAALHRAKEIARAEMARRRGRLGTLTREQEVGLENLMISTVTNVAELVGRVLESLPTVP